ncbi:MAG: RNA polymerase sigma factor [Halanaerobiaceae bacterium]
MELIKRYKAGDKQAFTELINRYQHRVYNTTFRMLGNHEDALDTAQETFIRVFNNIDNFKFKSNFSTWLFRITGNLCRDELRKRNNNLKMYSIQNDRPDLETRDQKEGNKNNPEKISLNKELQKVIQEKIDQLPQTQKTVIVLRDIQGFSYKEIAEVLDISMGTVKSRLSRARSGLRNRLNRIKKGGIKRNET